MPAAVSFWRMQRSAKPSRPAATSTADRDREQRDHCLASVKKMRACVSGLGRYHRQV